ncbi:MAG TPA: hypothetical protein VMV81_11880, partial [Phycisphaerae bacterium]|nr:hypothetical protein [Phycisphaerae bacterium]
MRPQRRKCKVQAPIQETTPIVPETQLRPVRLLRRVRWFVVWALLAVLIAGMTGWMGLAVYYSNLHGGAPRTLLAGAVVIISLSLVIIYPRKRVGLAMFLCAFAAVVGWFFSLKPSGNLDWSPEYAVMPSVTREGDIVR